MCRAARWTFCIVLLAFMAGAWFSRPQRLDTPGLDALQPDLANGELLYHAGGCAACHGSVIVANGTGTGAGQQADPTRLGGGLELSTPAGIFRIPNISPHPDDGIGDWSRADFVNAMAQGLAPDGSHYYPAFPYTSYTRMRLQDLVDLKAYLDSLPAVAGRPQRHALRWPLGWRRPLGIWKRLFLDSNPVVEVMADDPQLMRGRYLAEGPGHCGECHTPRGWLQNSRTDQWLAGAPAPDGEGRVPDITPRAKRVGGWSAAKLAYYFETGLDPDYDTVGGSMVEVQENLARLPESDREAIAAYLKALPSAP